MSNTSMPMIEQFSSLDAVESPIEQDDDSTFSLNTTQLSLPDSFDDTICLRRYKRKVNGRSDDPFTKQQHHGEGQQILHDTKLDSNAASSRSHHNCLPRNAETRDVNNLSMESLPFHDDLESKVRELFAINLGLKEKGRLYDSLKRRSDGYEAELSEMRTQMQKQTTLYDESILREKELRHQILEYKRKVQLLNIDVDHSRNEAALLLDRAEKAEKEHEASASALRNAQQKHESTITRLAKEREEAKWLSKEEMTRLREESSKEIINSRTQQKEAFSREAKLLSDARDTAVEQAKHLQQELKDLKTEKETKELENSDIIKELERQLADVRVELKIKSCELNTLQACQDRTMIEAQQSKSNNEKIKEALALMQRDYAKLEHESTIETNRLKELIRQKDDDLEFYRHDDFLVACDDVETVKPDGNCLLPGRNALIKNSVSLARKCRDLEVQSKKLISNLTSEKEKNKLLAKKEESHHRLLQSLSIQKNASAYIVAAVNVRDKEIEELNTKIDSLQMDLDSTKQERDGLSLQLSKILGRRDQLDEMKGLVERIKCADLFPRRISASDEGDVRQAEKARADDDMEGDDLVDHIRYRRNSFQDNANHVSWHKPRR